MLFRSYEAVIGQEYELLHSAEKSSHLYGRTLLPSGDTVVVLESSWINGVEHRDWVHKDYVRCLLNGVPTNLLTVLRLRAK